jgi:hypothetical protein
VVYLVLKLVEKNVRRFMDIASVVKSSQSKQFDQGIGNSWHQGMARSIRVRSSGPPVRIRMARDSAVHWPESVHCRGGPPTSTARRMPRAED